MFHLVSVRIEKSVVWRTSLLDEASPFLLLNLELEVDYLISSLANVMQTRANSFGHYFPPSWFEFQKYISHRVFKTENVKKKANKTRTEMYNLSIIKCIILVPNFLNLTILPTGVSTRRCYCISNLIWILTETFT